MSREIKLKTPLTATEIMSLQVGDHLYLSGRIFCGRDAVLPKIVEQANRNNLDDLNVVLEGGVIFHTAVSPAGVGPTSSNKEEIESSIEPLSAYGVRLHIGKGKLKDETVDALGRNNSAYGIIPPTTALLTDKMKSKSCVCYPELGMEALYEIEVEDYPIIVAAVNGETIYDNR